MVKQLIHRNGIKEKFEAIVRRLCSPEVIKTCAIASVAVIAISMAPDSMAGTDGAEFKPAYDKFTQLITGFGGKMVAGVSLATAIVGSALRFNPYLIFGSIGVGLASTFGIKVLDTIVGAII